MPPAAPALLSLFCLLGATLAGCTAAAHDAGTPALAPHLVAAQQPPATTISGGDLPYAVQLSALDADAFGRRLNLPPKLDEAPETGSRRYLVTSAYWQTAIREDEEDPAPETTAYYYPDGAYVLGRRGDEDVWLVLDLRQRALLDRYIRLAREGRIGERPGTLEVLAAAALSEPIGVAIGARALTAAEARQFWQLAAAVPLRRDLTPVLPPLDVSEDGMLTWIVFTLPEGRALRLGYVPRTGTLFDIFATETYTVSPDWLTPLFGEAALPGPGFDLAPGVIEQQQGRGSPLWWLVAGGAGAVSLALAVWLRRAPPKRR